MGMAPAGTFLRQSASYDLAQWRLVQNTLLPGWLVQTREADMERKKVNADKISRVGFEAGIQVLEIEFSDGGIVQYSRVPSEVHWRLMAAPTMAGYFPGSDRGRVERAAPALVNPESGAACVCLNPPPARPSSARRAAAAPSAALPRSGSTRSSRSPVRRSST
jgi:KTSC domain